MAALIRNSTVTQVAPIYSVRVQDPGQEFSDYEFIIATQDVGNGNLTAAAVDAAVRAFAASLVGSYSSFVQGPMTKTSVADASFS